MSTPAIIYLILCFFGLGFMLNDHGKMRKVNFWISLIAWVFVVLPLLYWGGFFE